MGLIESFKDKLSTIGSWFTKIRDDAGINQILTVASVLCVIGAIWIVAYQFELLLTGGFLYLIRPKKEGP